MVATARRLEAIADLESQGCAVMPLDVTSEASMADAVRTVESRHGAVSVLVNNAGYSQSGSIETVPLNLVRAQFETNVFGLARLTQLVLPGMRRQRWGRIVNLSSMGGRLVFPGGGYYHATKYAIEALSDALRFEVQGFGIDVIVIQPGLIRTAFSATAVSGMAAAHDKPGVYDAFHAAVARVTRESYYKGSLAPLAGVPDDVAMVIAQALNARRPRTRYTVSRSATVMMTLRRVLSDRLWDRLLSRAYPVPR